VAGYGWNGPPVQAPAGWREQARCRPRPSSSQVVPMVFLNVGVAQPLAGLLGWDRGGHAAVA
jgi:hypothetical protein